MDLPDLSHSHYSHFQVLVNEFSLLNTMWFAVGSLMQQGSDIVPKYGCKWAVLYLVYCARLYCTAYYYTHCFYVSALRNVLCLFFLISSKISFNSGHDIVFTAITTRKRHFKHSCQDNTKFLFTGSHQMFSYFLIEKVFS